MSEIINKKTPGGQTFARIVKKVDEIVNNSTTLQDDDELTVSLNANKIYAGFLIIWNNSTDVADKKWAMSIPSGASGDWSTSTISSSSSALGVITSPLELASTGVNQLSIIFFRVIIAGTPGSLIFQWAQRIQEATDSKILKGSSLVVWEETA